MEIALVAPTVPSRPCRFCLSLQGDSVFADFDVDAEGRVFAVRVSFDGYGCCDGYYCCEPARARRMNQTDSEALLAMVQQGSMDPAAPILRAYLRKNRQVFWSDALEHHGLL